MASYGYCNPLFLAVQVVLILDRCSLSGAQNTYFRFSYFTTNDVGNRIILVNDADLPSDKPWIALNAGSESSPNFTCGRLLYNDKVRMKGSGAAASFRTAFTFWVYSPDVTNSYHGDGLAFTFARTDKMDGDPGSTMCLLNSSNNGNSSNRLFAVEFDTFLNDWLNDSSDSHIGINVNSMNSTPSYNLCRDSITSCSYLATGGNFTAWIDYDSKSQALQVFFANGSLDNHVAKPLKPLINASVQLYDVLDDYMYVGFSASTGHHTEVHYIQSWEFTSSGMPELPLVQPPYPGPEIANTPPVQPPYPGLEIAKTSNSSNVGIIAGATAGAALVSMVLIIFVICRRRKKVPEKFSLVGDASLGMRMFAYKELSKATKNFNKSELLGKGGFGAVYRGSLPSGALVAVKRISMEKEHGKESFQAEVTSLSRIRHRNLVLLRGWCHEAEQLLLVYDYMCNGSLDEWLFQAHHASLPLTRRCSILHGVAAALCYLHEECTQCVLHRDIKASNVLLDGDWNACLGDFGLARVINHQKMEKTTMMAGTIGYMAPELSHTGKATKKSDVYSFGVLMLEVMCGSRVTDTSASEQGEGNLVGRVRRAHEEGNLLTMADPRLEAAFIQHPNAAEVELQESFLITDDGMGDRTTVANLMHLGLLCCNPNPEGRPSMLDVSRRLQPSEADMEMSLPPLPEFKPQSRLRQEGFDSGVVPSWSSWSSSSGANVHETAHETLSYQMSTPSSSSGVCEEPANKMQTSFAAPDSSVFSGR